MIFFLHATTKTANDDGWKASVLLAARNEPRGASWAGIAAWNEVYPLAEGDDPLANLRNAVRDAIREDPECQRVLAAGAQAYGVDLDAAPWDGILRSTLHFWAHPRIGNISATWPNPPTRRVEEFHASNWATCSFLDDTTKAAVLALDHRMGDLEKASKDQARLCHNIIDLARALLGEVTSHVGRMLERRFAFELSTSAGLHRALGALIDSLLNSDRMTMLPRNIDFDRQTEYLRYYLLQNKSELDAVGAAARYGILESLLESALPPLPGGGTRVSETSRQALLADQAAPLVQDIVGQFERLPPVVRCAILANDLRKVFGLGAPPLAVASLRSVGDGPLLRAGAEAQGAPVRLDSPEARATLRGTGAWKYSANFARDERDVAVQTYRRALCPLWAGPSGHVAKAIHFWREQLGNAFPIGGEATLCAGLFTFWRLYYDKRYSPTHTLAETCDGSFVDSEVKQHFAADGLDGTADDPFELWQRASTQLPYHSTRRRTVGATAPMGPRYRGRHEGRAIGRTAAKRTVVNGIALHRALRDRYYDGGGPDHAARRDALTTGIEAEVVRLRLAEYDVIRWSHELHDEAILLGGPRS